MLDIVFDHVWKWEWFCGSCLCFCCCVAPVTRLYHLIVNHMMNARKAVGKAYRRTRKWCAATWNSIRCYPRTHSPIEQSHCEYARDAFTLNKSHPHTAVSYSTLSFLSTWWIFKHTRLLYSGQNWKFDIYILLVAPISPSKLNLCLCLVNHPSLCHSCLQCKCKPHVTVASCCGRIHT